MKRDKLLHDKRRCLAFALLIGIKLLISACAPSAVRYNNAGNQQFAEGAYDGAIAEYRRAQVEDPDQAEPYYNAANAYNRKAALDAVKAQAEQALKTADAELATQTWYNLGNAFFDAEQWPQAVAAYQEALRINPDDLDAKHNLELALQRLEEEQRQRQGQEDQEEIQSETGDQSEADEATPTPVNQSGLPEFQEQATPEPTGEEQAPITMSPEQAIQLLEALVGNGDTLQERLQKVYRAPGPQPERDW